MVQSKIHFNLVPIFLFFCSIAYGHITEDSLHKILQLSDTRVWYDNAALELASKNPIIWTHETEQDILRKLPRSDIPFTTLIDRYSLNMFGSSLASAKHEHVSNRLRAKLSDIICQAHILDDIITDNIMSNTTMCTSRYSRPIRAVIESQLYIQTDDCFTTEKILLNGLDERFFASITVHPIPGNFEVLYIIKGNVNIRYGKNNHALSQRSCIFIPAAFSSSYELFSATQSAVLLLYPKSIS